VISLNLSNPNIWTVNQTFNYSSSTIYSSFLNSSSTFSTIGTLTLPNITGTQCLHSISGVVSGTGSDCGSGGSNSFAFPFDPTTYGGNVVQATGTTLWLQDVTDYGLIAS